MRIAVLLGLIATALWFAWQALSVHRVPDCDGDTLGQVPAFSPEAIQSAQGLVCRLREAPLNAQAAARALRNKPITTVESGGVLTVLARSGEDSVSLTGGLRGPMQRLDGSADIWWASYRLAYPDRSLLFFWLDGKDGERGQGEFAFWRGGNAPAIPPQARNLRGTIRRDTLASARLGETRVLSVYLPPGYPNGAPYKAIFMTDGQLVGLFARFLEPLMDRGSLPPLVLVGSLSGKGSVHGSEVSRSRRGDDYVPGRFWSSSFDHHLGYFADELVALAEQRYAVSADPKDRAVWGSSDGGTFALQAGARRPDRFGAVFASSTSVALRADQLAAGDVAFFISAGVYEPGFYEHSRGSSEVLAAAGRTTSFEIYAAGHSTEQWFLAMLSFAPKYFGPAGVALRAPLD